MSHDEHEAGGTVAEHDAIGRRQWLALAGGAVLGGSACWGALRAVEAHPRVFSPGSPSATGVAALRHGPEIRLSFIETGRSTVPARRLVQGATGRLDAVFRVAIVDHPDGRVFFSTGVDHDSAPAWTRRVSNPFGPVRDVRPLASYDLGRARFAVLPSLRWHHVGGLAALSGATQVLATSGEQWVGLRGPMPHRYAIDRAALEPLADRIASVPWGQRYLMGRERSFDLFGDGSVWLFSLKGASYDEVGMLIALPTGATVALVADAVFTRDQVINLRPSAPMLTWSYQRNRMQLLTTQRRLHHASAGGIEVIPLLDGSLHLPRPDAL